VHRDGFLAISHITAYFTLNIIYLAAKNMNLTFLKVAWRFIVTSKLKSICMKREKGVMMPDVSHSTTTTKTLPLF